MRQGTTVLLSLAVGGAFVCFVGCSQNKTQAPTQAAVAPTAAAAAASLLAVSPCPTTPIPSVTFNTAVAPDTCMNPGNYTPLVWRKSELSTTLTNIKIPDWTGIGSASRPTWPDPILAAPCTGTGINNSCSTTSDIQNFTLWTVIRYSITMTNSTIPPYTRTIYGHIIIKP